MPRDWLGRMSPKWPIMCRVGRKTLTQSVVFTYCTPEVRIPGTRARGLLSGRFHLGHYGQLSNHITMCHSRSMLFSSVLLADMSSLPVLSLYISVCVCTCRRFAAAFLDILCMCQMPSYRCSSCSAVLFAALVRSPWRWSVEKVWRWYVQTVMLCCSIATVICRESHTLL